MNLSKVPIIGRFSKKPEVFEKNKSTPAVGAVTEVTRDGFHKTFTPKYLYKPPFGYPRFTNIPYLRWLAKTPYVEMCVQMIIDELSAIPWDIVAEEGFEEKVGEETILAQKNFFLNPNTNKESFEDVFIRRAVRDVLEIDSGVLVKVFNLREQMVEVVCRDGMTFTKNPNVHGMFTDRKDIILSEAVRSDELSKAPESYRFNLFNRMSPVQAREQAAYFQYGWVTGPVPIPFGRREIIWLERSPRTDEYYGTSRVEVLSKVLQSLLYSIDSDLSYYNDNNVPKGVLSLLDAEADDIEAFTEQWEKSQYRLDEFNQWKKRIHKMPIVGMKPEFTRIAFSPSEMQEIEKQKWYSKLVWACFGATATELGFTEDAKGLANQIIQSKTFRKRGLYPLLRKLEWAINTQILPEFGENHTRFKFLIFDIDDEKNKYELYKLQTESALKTINEVRNEEGLEPVEWGDEPPKSWKQSENSFSFGNPLQENIDKNNQRDKEKQVERDEEQAEDEAGKKARLKIKSKPSVEGKETPGNIKKKVKALGPSSVLIPREGEIVTEDRIRRALLYVVRLSEKKLLESLKKEVREDQLLKIKALPDLLDRLRELISFSAVKDVLNKAVTTAFYSGYEEAGKKLRRNFVPNPYALDFLKKYTFDYVKNLEEETMNRLQGELRRGMMEGEGAGKLMDRVRKVFDVSEKRAEDIVRTEINRAENRSLFIAWQESGIEAHKWLEWVDDTRTSEVTKALHREYGSPEQAIPLNKVFRVTLRGKEISGLSPPFHVGERDKLKIITAEEYRIARKQAGLSE